MLYAQCSYIFGFYCTVGNQTPWCMKLYLFLLKQFKRNTSKYRLMILLIGCFSKTMEIHLSFKLLFNYAFNYTWCIEMSRNWWNVWPWWQINLNYASKPQFSFWWTSTFYMQRSTMMVVINEEVKCTIRIVANNCFIFQNTACWQ